MVHAPSEHAPRQLLLDRQPEPRTVPVAAPAMSRRSVDGAPEAPRQPILERSPRTPATRHRRVYTTVIVVMVVSAVLLLLAGSPSGAFVFGLIAGSVSLARYFHAVATRPEQHD